MKQRSIATSKRRDGPVETLWRYAVVQVVDVLAYERDEDIVLLEHELFHYAGRMAIGDGWRTLVGRS